MRDEKDCKDSQWNFNTASIFTFTGEHNLLTERLKM